MFKCVDTMRLKDDEAKIVKIFLRKEEKKGKIMWSFFVYIFSLLNHLKVLMKVY